MVKRTQRSINMQPGSSNMYSPARLCMLGAALCACFSGAALLAQDAAPKPAATSTAPLPPGVRLFETPQKAADALIEAAETFDLAAMTHIFGPDGNDIVMCGEVVQDRKHATDFTAEARKKNSISVDPKNGRRAFLLVGEEDWSFPVPLVKRNSKWFFDSKAGRQELVYRRIGANELDAIEVCRGYVEAQ